MANAPVMISRPMLRHLVEDALSLQQTQQQDCTDCDDEPCKEHQATQEGYKRLLTAMDRADVRQQVNPEVVNVGKIDTIAHSIARYFFDELRDECLNHHSEHDVEDGEELYELASDKLLKLLEKT